MKANKTSGIISSPTGFYILRAHGHRAEWLLPYSGVKAGIRRSLLEERIRKRGQELEKQFPSKAQILVP